MKEIAEHLLVSAPSATSFMETLIKGGYSKRVLDENDRRVVRITLTSKGKQEIENIINAVKSHMAKAFDKLDEKEREDFRKALQSLLKSLNN
jgi:DNA-binding MarR family transcriptional regulator